jgi:hypothetical protein
MSHDHCSSCARDLLLTRRNLLTRLGGGIASLAFADLLGQNGLLAAEAQQQRGPLAPKPQMIPAKAKAVISIFCYGGVSQVDTFDPKPDLLKYQGETMQGVGEVRATMGTPGGLMPSFWNFKKHGQCGMEVSDLFPNVAEHVDDIALIRSMYSLSPAHGPALFQMNTGSILAGFPSVGSWITYGLGSENQDLPGFIVFTDHRGGPINGPPNWGNGYMPAAYQGMQMRDTGNPIVDLKPPVNRTEDEQRKWLRLLHELNEKHASQFPQDTELAAHSLVRARVPDADLGARSHRHQQGDRGDEEAVWRRRRADGLLRAAGTDGAPSGRTRRALRADLLRRRQLRTELGRPLGS